MAYLYLSIAIVAEVIATSALKASNQLTVTLPTVVSFAGYGVAFYFLALCFELFGPSVLRTPSPSSIASRPG